MECSEGSPGGNARNSSAESIAKPPSSVRVADMRPDLIARQIVLLLVPVCSAAYRRLREAIASCPVRRCSAMFRAERLTDCYRRFLAHPGHFPSCKYAQRRDRRTKAALAAAKARGQALGNPRLAEARAIAHATLKAEAEAHADAVMPAIHEAQASGAKSLRQIAAALNGRGVATARGGKWEAATVRNILRRGA